MQTLIKILIALIKGEWWRCSNCNDVIWYRQEPRCKRCKNGLMFPKDD